MGCVVVCDHEGRAAHALHLVRQQVAPLRLGIVGDDAPCTATCTSGKSRDLSGSHRCNSGLAGGLRVTSCDHVADMPCSLCAR